MFMIVNPNAKRFYLAAVYSREEDAKAFVDLCENKDDLRVDKLAEGHDYPFFLVEQWTDDAQTVGQFLPLPDAKHVYSMIEEIVRLDPRPEDDHEHTYMNVYRITEDFHGDQKHPGQDYMGILDHDHIDDAWLDSLDASEMPGIQWKTEK